MPDSTVVVIRGFDLEPPKGELIVMRADIASDLKPCVTREVGITSPCLPVAASTAQGFLPLDKQVETYNAMCPHSDSVVLLDYRVCALRHDPAKERTTTT